MGHMKNDYGMDRNWFLRKDGDQIYALMLGYGFNLRKLLRAFDVHRLKKFFQQFFGNIFLSWKKCPAMVYSEV
jgi:transposase, IS5 family